MDDSLNRVFFVDDEPHIRRFLSYNVRQIGYETTLASNGIECLEKLRNDSFGALLLDIRMPEADGLEVLAKVRQECPRMPVIMITADHNIATAVIAIKMGAFDYLTKPIDFDRLEIVLRNALKQNQLEKQVDQLSGQLKRNEIFTNIVGQSESLQMVFGQAEKILNTNLNVLITGESGTGKELLAQAIHYGSERKNGTFVAVNCAAITHELAESLIFGHKKGSFTGAIEDRPGYFEQANNGTIFLDEIGDMTLEVQAKVLRVLEEKQVQRVGSQQVLKLDFRVVSATNRDLVQAVRERSFRKDLYFRLEEYPINLPPLRERKEDIPLLVDHFLNMFAAEMGVKEPAISQEALEVLMEYDFPGNVRELKNIIEHALIKSGGSIILPWHLRLIPSNSKPSSSERIEELVIKRSSGYPANDGMTYEERILAYVREHGSISNSECRDLLSIDLHQASYLLKKLHKYGLLKREGERRWARYRLP